MWWNVADFINNTWSNLSNMHIDQKTIVSVDLEKLIFREIFSIDVVLNIAVLMRQDDVWVSEFVSWGFEIINLKVLLLFVLIETEVEVALGSYLGIGISLKSNFLFLCKLVLKSHFLHFLLKHFRNFVFDSFDFRVVVWAYRSESSEEFLSSVNITEHINVILRLSSNCSLTCYGHVRYLLWIQSILIIQLVSSTFSLNSFLERDLSSCKFRVESLSNLRKNLFALVCS